MGVGAIAGIAGGLLGAIAGGQGSPTSGNSTVNAVSRVDLQDFDAMNKGRSGLEAAGYNTAQTGLTDLTNMVNAGPGQQAITDATSAGNDFASLLQSYIQNNGLASSAQQSYAKDYATNMFAPQQLALQQSFTDQGIQGARAASRLGRSNMDPVLRNKLGVEQTRQQQMLNAQQGAFAAQTADGMPARQIGMADSLFNVRQNLASQAFTNRQTLMSLGSQLTANERNYRLAGATKNTNTQSAISGMSGGGVGGMLSGALAGAGMGVGTAGKLSSMNEDEG